MRPEDKPDSPEYKKKQAMIKGPVLELAQENANAYGMDECTFTGLKDIFLALIESQSRTGVLSPQRFLEIFRRDNEMFRNSMHQDAHEFYGLVLNDIISNVEAAAKHLEQAGPRDEDGLGGSVQNALSAPSAVKMAQSGPKSPGAGWVHDIFEGVLTSETRCLTCETASKRDETFLDLSIDLEQFSSVTSCLRKFSAEEMLCERNKFHCDHCGGLQEAEKRMKIKKLPKVLALHLKRFKYSDDFTRLEKLCHEVIYPYHLRIFNTTDDAHDPDRLYELYAVVVHIGGNAYHGHYVSIIKTKERGWLLFDDEMVEPVDKHFVRNFFGDLPGTACAYVLFYQEISFEKLLEEQDAEGLEEVKLASQTVDLDMGDAQPNGIGHTLSRHLTQPSPPVEDREEFISLDYTKSAPGAVPSGPDEVPPVPPIPKILPNPTVPTSPLVGIPPPAPATSIEKPMAKPEAKSKEEKEREKKEARAAEKARKVAEKEQREQAKVEERQRKERSKERQKAEVEDMRRAMAASKHTAAIEDDSRTKDSSDSSPATPKSPGFLSRSARGSKSMTRKSFGFLLKEKDKDKGSENGSENGESSKTENGVQNGTAVHSQLPELPELPPLPTNSGKHPLKERFSFGLSKKKSSAVLH